jgi:hypothetical protein
MDEVPIKKLVAIDAKKLSHYLHYFVPSDSND